METDKTEEGGWGEMHRETMEDKACSGSSEPSLWAAGKEQISPWYGERNPFINGNLCPLQTEEGRAENIFLLFLLFLNCLRP